MIGLIVIGLAIFVDWRVAGTVAAVAIVAASRKR